MTETNQQPSTIDAATRDPDAELVRLADEIAVGEAETVRLTDLADATDDRAEEERIWTIIRAKCDRIWEKREAMVRIPATTPAGFKAKAQIVRLYGFAGDGYARVDDPEALAWSLANEILGIPTI